MKVVQLLPELNGGGVERGTMEVAKALVDAGHESTVISAGGHLVQQLEADGSRHLSWDLGRKSIFTLRHVQPLRRWLLQEQPDILHLRSRLPAWIGWMAWRKLPEQSRPRLISTVHGLYSVSSYSAIMCKPEKIIAVSNTVVAYIRNNYPDTDMNKVALIHRGVDPNDFPRNYQPSAAWLAEWYRQYPQLKGQRVLTLPGRLSRSKGHHDFIYLLLSLKQRGIECRGLIVGDTNTKHKSYISELRQLVTELGLEGDVVFTGPRNDMREIYAISNLVLSLSIKPESFGRTVVEALSIGTPVVGYNHGGVGEILSALFPQGLVSMKDGTGLSNRVHALLAKQDTKVNENLFLLQDMLEATLNCYDELLMSKQPQNAAI